MLTHIMMSGCAAYTAAAMLAAQHSSIDMLMNYDARPSSWCSLFKPYMNAFPQKTYYSLWMFNKLYRAEAEAEVIVLGDDLYALAAKGDDASFVMLSYFNNDDEHKGADVEITFSGLPSKGTVEFYLIDSENDSKCVRTENFASTEMTVKLDTPNNTVYLLKIIG